MTENKVSLLNAAAEVVMAFDEDDLDWHNRLSDAVEVLHCVVEDQRMMEHALPVLLAGVREEMQKLGCQQATALFDDLVSCLEELVDLPLEYKLKTERLVKHEDVWEMVPNAPPGAEA